MNNVYIVIHFIDDGSDIKGVYNDRQEAINYIVSIYNHLTDITYYNDWKHKTITFHKPNDPIAYEYVYIEEWSII